VDNAINLDPKSPITGGWRYAFNLSGELGLIANSQSDRGRHDFVNNSNSPKGPNVFYKSVATNSNSDTGPHQRWSTGSLWDNITVQGHDIDVRNRGSYGTTHGWSGANMVVWNSTARAFRVQNPPTSQNWLVGSKGPIIEDMTFGPQPSGYYDQSGPTATPVTTGGTTSLYEAQMNDARDITSFHSQAGVGNWNDANQWSPRVAPTDSYSVALRDYLIGDVDQFVYDGASSVDNAFINPAWQSAVAGSSALPITKFDDVSGNENVAFTIQHTLDAGDQVVHGFLALGLKQSGAGNVNDDFIRFFDTSPANKLNFTDLGWNTQITSTQTFVGVIDLGGQIEQLQTGSINLQVSDNTGVDWAIYTVAVAAAKNNSLNNQVFIDGGGTIVVDQVVAPVRQLQVGGLESGKLQLTADALVEIVEDFSLLGNGTLTVDIAGTSLGEFGALEAYDTAMLGGTLEVALADNFEPAAGNSFPVISAGEILGTFDALDLPSLTPGLVWHVDYQPTSVNLLPLYAADFNADGNVDSDDLADWQIGYGSNSAEHSDGDADGDADGDGDVDGADFLVWQRQFGNSANLINTLSIPEPSAVALALAGMLNIIPCRLAF
jgi:hypothetical protein